MSWMATLEETYRNMEKSSLFDSLLPIAHTTQQAHIEVTINELSEFVTANVIAKEDAETVIPSTEQSSGRAGSHPVNHPLMDKLQYVAGDYTLYGGEKGDSFHKKYMEDLRAWCQSEYANPKVQALCHYLEKGILIQDLVREKVLHCDENKKLYQSYPDKETEPEIFKRVTGNQSDAFVRFIVNGFPLDNESKAELWKDRKLQKDYINYYLSKREGKGLCYITGELQSLSVNHPSKLRNTGDMAKLISSNDMQGFTYRGRFLSADEAAGISYEASQRAHNALKWLVNDRGKNYGGRVFITWNPNMYEVPDIYDDSYDLIFGKAEKKPVQCTAEEFAEELGRYMNGYSGKISYYDRIAILGMDAATTGRMAITFYRESLKNELIENLGYWHSTCAWRHRYKFTKQKEVIEFYGAPAPRDIALAAYGIERSNYLEMEAKLEKNIVECLLHCIIDRAELPYDIVKAAYRNACHPQNYNNYFTWFKVVTISCALLRKYYLEREKEEWSMEVDYSKESLPYLCGRLLAVADVMERRTYSEDDKKRTTNAMRYFTKFMEHPCQTWETLNKLLPPYLAKHGEKAFWYQKLLGEISTKLEEQDFLEARNLDGRMLLGFYAQFHEMNQKHETEKTEEKKNEE
ncbi:type I-C CRISPR-associated protein Cas8c/Csd1 [Anaerocolumna cellulosilytica]|uniref:Type I-C CRISPR-associated protein Cas8c/Csd1 n=1 Tax=Anaerocolumna cellulosilytica TaxID=433286 RepID=A0A6S6R2P8_9FIRM|nr:type I-C CRISPR-associated protein Cas8c/Csd1 [Anaerocolumna cellulosilytica]MBB5194691.1 CRISPR-associated protein Csd1 [Anaerocolumna cellulosilytica]BCJ94347.1 type I-C CRISPR-associated protein Cas8c/Csd1 [Anaerocolumna cellulosilytica]